MHEPLASASDLDDDGLIVGRELSSQSPAAAAAAAIPFRALTTRARDPDHRGGVRRGHTVGYGPLFPTRDETTGLPLMALPEGFR
jgi:hypothetical protein